MLKIPIPWSRSFSQLAVCQKDLMQMGAIKVFSIGHRTKKLKNISAF